MPRPRALVWAVILTVAPLIFWHAQETVTPPLSAASPAQPAQGAISKGDRDRALGIGCRSARSKTGWRNLTIDGIRLNRQNLRNIEYLTYVLDPHPEMDLELQYPLGDQHRVQIKAKLSQASDLAYRPGAGITYDLIRNSGLDYGAEITLANAVMT